MVPISFSKVFGPFALYPCRFNWTVYSLRNRLLYSLVLLVLLHKEEKRSNTTREYFRPGVERNIHFTQFSYRGNITVIFLLHKHDFSVTGGLKLSCNRQNFVTTVVKPSFM